MKQNVQPINENILSIFVQICIDTVFSVKKFLGRKRNRDYDVYVQYGKHMNKRKYSIPNNMRNTQIYYIIKYVIL